VFSRSIVRGKDQISKIVVRYCSDLDAKPTFATNAARRMGMDDSDVLQYKEEKEKKERAAIVGHGLSPAHSVMGTLRTRGQPEPYDQSTL
jgi:hypothetical protein